MTLEHGGYKITLAEEVKKLIKISNEDVNRLAVNTARLKVIKDEVDANDPAIFDLPADQNWLNPKLVNLRASIQVLAASL